MGGATGSNGIDMGGNKYPQLAVRPVGKQIHKLYRDRLRQFTDGGQYRQQGLLDKIIDDRLTGDWEVKLHVWSAPGQTRPTFEEATSQDNKYRKTHKGESFGPSWTTHWFKLQFKVPQDWTYKPLVELHWDSHSEGMVWTDDGKPLQGLTGNGERVEWILSPHYRRYDREHTIYIEMSCNAMFGNAPGGDNIQPPSPDKYFTLSEADIVSINPEARALFYDFWIIGDAAREFPEDGWEEHQALQIANEIMDVFIAGDGSRESIRKGREIAKRYLGEKIDTAEVFGSDEDALVTGIGNCHIDTCWLWPWAETKRKIARSWSNQCDLLDRYPEYRFVASQAQQFKWLEKLYPYAWDRVKDHVKKGTFQTIGGSWVEHDTNLPSGESLVRQFLYGQRFFESRFGERCRTFWLPDTFGYSSQLPQICRLAGMNRFFTQKLSWNNINNFPHTTFNWVSLDGSQVICHMAPVETYTSEANFDDVERSVTQHKSMDQDATSLLPYGKGDGGGGPTFGHLEKLRRCRGLSDKVGRLPRVHLGNSVEDFFDRLEKKAASGERDLVTWYGELYFELHRGTYTSQAANKRNNRKAEFLLRDIEYLATVATISGKKSYKYPKKDIDTMWEGVLLCQFHDCLPGSSIEMCYEDSDKLYAEVFEIGEKLIEGALDALGCNDDLSEAHRIGINTLGWDRDMLHRAQDGEPTVMSCFGGLGLPVDRQRDDGSAASVKEVRDGVFLLKNGDLEVEVEAGVITSLYDVKARREVVPKGKKANQLVLFDDKPLYWQAWDVEVFHLGSRRELKSGKSVIVEDSHERVAVSTTTQISDESWIKTTVSLCASSQDGQPSYVETEAEVEWHETMKFLKVEFPTDIINTEASYETQFGIVRRPTHYNTSWDMAKFEVCHHKWADLSENGYGVSVLNDSKYGFATIGDVMRLSLLRAPKAPDANADMKRHHIRWAILPHAGPLDHRTIRAGYSFNSTVRTGKHANPAALHKHLSSMRLTEESNKSLVVDTIKRAEDDEDVCTDATMTKAGRHVIVRVFDSLGGRSRGKIDFGPVKVSKAWKCNLLEDNLEDVDINDGGIEIELRAFEVASFKLKLE